MLHVATRSALLSISLAVLIGAACVLVRPPAFTRDRTLEVRATFTYDAPRWRMGWHLEREAFDQPGNHQALADATRRWRDRLGGTQPIRVQLSMYAPRMGTWWDPPPTWVVTDEIVRMVRTLASAIREDEP